MLRRSGVQEDDNFRSRNKRDTKITTLCLPELAGGIVSRVIPTKRNTGQKKVQRTSHQKSASYVDRGSLVIMCLVQVTMIDLTSLNVNSS